MLKKRQPLQLTQFSSVGNEPGVFDVVIINDDLERAYEELKDILSDVSKIIKYPFAYLCDNYFATIVCQLLHRPFYIHNALDKSIS